MARIPYITREAVAPDALAEFDALTGYGPFAHLAGAMGHRAPILRNTARMLAELREEGVLPRRYLELALVAVSLLNQCDYCVAHHGPMLSVEGVSPEGVQGLLAYETHPELDDVDKLVVAYAHQVTLEPNRTRDEIFARLRRHFSDAQIVELTWRIALCGAFNRFNDVLQLEIEESARASAA
ncbi:MAG: carboxymuconolactone decarboxylase family protein [Alphaproteobacteria bacterium]|nr:carboxymuconolactone decarboxylase family protein [Alphaproteobacteria bacterium]MCB9931359.1 carboxymuconolactone decarboxylase family protein [Alphaproteobacteria bacterium]